MIGWEEQIDHTVRILCKRRKNNPCLIGEPGVGKTAIAKGISLRIVNNNVPSELRDKKVISIDMGPLVAGTSYRGQFEEKMTKIIDEVKSCGNVILFIDEVHTLVGAGRVKDSTLDAANILKPPLPRGELKFIGATTLSEYQKHIEKDPALERRFQPILVPEPSIEQVILMIQGLRQSYEAHHNVQYEDEAIVAAVKFSDRYIRYNMHGYTG
ncbi:hypothetical protein Sjap_016639 [Stephania japonica]|uniref:AAA+ ATPase domain-containing protein n=1 Tax=Stephania japonica TaxID=461633 RepID=A0AAP0INC1_9MAGN